MSHFTVIVIGENIEEQLEPYAEQEVKEEYLSFKDIEDEYRQEYKEKQVDIVMLSDGSKFSKYDQKFRTYKGFDSQYVYPEDANIYEGKFDELYEDFETFMSQWAGHDEPDEKTGRYGYWHNENAKWDWYSVGGRWTGYFLPKAGAQGQLGVSGAFDNKPQEGWVDIIQIKDMDIEGMQKDAVEKANKTYDELDEVLQGRTLPSWTAIREKHGENIDAAREEYNSLDVTKDLNKAKFFCFGDLVQEFGPDRASYVERCKNSIVVPYAVVKDGKWYQKGEMGWFGMSSDEMTQDEWNKQFWEMIKSLPEETTLTMVDCHI